MLDVVLYLIVLLWMYQKLQYYLQTVGVFIFCRWCHLANDSESGRRSNLNYLCETRTARLLRISGSWHSICADWISRQPFDETRTLLMSRRKWLWIDQIQTREKNTLPVSWGHTPGMGEGYPRCICIIYSLIFYNYCKGKAFHIGK